MAELGQGHAPDPSRIKEGRCIISRNGSGASFGSTAIESGRDREAVGSASPAIAANESSQSPSTYSNDDSPAPPPSTSSLVLNAAGVVEKVIDGRKVIDFTDVPRPGRGGIPRQKRGEQQQQQQPQYTYALNNSTAYELETAASQSMATAAMMYSQQMNYYYGMPGMWPGAAGTGAYPGWPMPAGLTPPPPPPPDTQPPPPPPPPPK